MPLENSDCDFRFELARSIRSRFGILCGTAKEQNPHVLLHRTLFQRIDSHWKTVVKHLTTWRRKQRSENARAIERIVTFNFWIFALNRLTISFHVWRISGPVFHFGISFLSSSVTAYAVFRLANEQTLSRTPQLGTIHTRHVWRFSHKCTAESRKVKSKKTIRLYVGRHTSDEVNSHNKHKPIWHRICAERQSNVCCLCDMLSVLRSQWPNIAWFPDLFHIIVDWSIWFIFFAWLTLDSWHIPADSQRNINSVVECTLFVLSCFSMARPNSLFETLKM